MIGRTGGWGGVVCVGVGGGGGVSWQVLGLGIHKGGRYTIQRTQYK